MTDYTPTTFAQALLATIGSPVTDANVEAVTAWEAQEGGNWHNTARYNPLNTTLAEPGSTTINSAGVRAYTSWDEGLTATASTLEEGSYQGIRDALAGGSDAQGVVNAILQSPWGTTGLTLGAGTVGGGTATPAVDQTSLTSGVTSSLNNLVVEALFVLGGVALLVVGLGKLTGTNPLRAAVHAAPGPL